MEKSTYIPVPGTLGDVGQRTKKVIVDRNVWMETGCGQGTGDYDGADQDQWGDYFEHGVDE